jgi:RNA polymerase sigma-70 factor (ECF subfamily)
VVDGACLELVGKHETSREGEVEAERALIRRAQRGDRSAFDTLVRRYDQEVLRMTLRMVRSEEEAQDLYQEVFLKVYRSLGRFRLEARFSTWLYRVVTNVCFDHLRQQKSRSEVPARAGADGELDYAQALADDRPGLNPEQALRAREISGWFSSSSTARG